jgi:hypothetical protein
LALRWFRAASTVMTNPPRRALRARICLRAQPTMAPSRQRAPHLRPLTGPGCCQKLAVSQFEFPRLLPCLTGHGYRSMFSIRR